MAKKLFAILATATFSLTVIGFTSLPAEASSLAPEACPIAGTALSETLVGTSGDDVICGLGGNDILRGGDGDDILRGGDGNDKIDGGAGSDALSGDSGNDSLVGGGGDDAMSGDGGHDRIIGGTGDDALNGGPGGDSLRSGLGEDTCAHDVADRHLDSCTLDRDAPTIEFSASNVAEISAGSLATFQWEAKDASGVAYTSAGIGGPPGWVDWCGFGIPGERIAGSAHLGTYEVRCEIPKNAVNESYTLFVGASDNLGNSGQSWAEFAFTIINGSSDNFVPQINDVRLPSTVRVGETFTVDVDVSDESGTAGMSSWFMGEAPYYYYDENGFFIEALDDATVVSGDAFNGALRQTFVVSDWARPGRYTLLISTRDAVGNRDFRWTEYSIVVTK